MYAAPSHLTRQQSPQSFRQQPICWNRSSCIEEDDVWEQSTPHYFTTTVTEADPELSDADLARLLEAMSLETPNTSRAQCVPQEKSSCIEEDDVWEQSTPHYFTTTVTEADPELSDADLVRLLEAMSLETPNTSRAQCVPQEKSSCIEEDDVWDQCVPQQPICWNRSSCIEEDDVWDQCVPQQPICWNRPSCIEEDDVWDQCVPQQPICWNRSSCIEEDDVWDQCVPQQPICWNRSSCIEEDDVWDQCVPQQPICWNRSSCIEEDDVWEQSTPHHFTTATEVQSVEPQRFNFFTTATEVQSVEPQRFNFFTTATEVQSVEPQRFNFFTTATEVQSVEPQRFNFFTTATEVQSVEPQRFNFFTTATEVQSVEPQRFNFFTTAAEVQSVEPQRFNFFTTATEVQSVEPQRFNFFTTATEVQSVEPQRFNFFTTATEVQQEEEKRQAEEETQRLQRSQQWRALVAEEELAEAGLLAEETRGRAELFAAMQEVLRQEEEQRRAEEETQRLQRSQQWRALVAEEELAEAGLLAEETRGHAELFAAMQEVLRHQVEETRAELALRTAARMTAKKRAREEDPSEATKRRKMTAGNGGYAPPVMRRLPRKALSTKRSTPTRERAESTAPAERLVPTQGRAERLPRKAPPTKRPRDDDDGQGETTREHAPPQESPGVLGKTVRSVISWFSKKEENSSRNARHPVGKTQQAKAEHPKTGEGERHPGSMGRR
ncbi:hypothetical protein, conserved [Angomonas deanei]|uniref:Uncharacterized protein n=1 Tax=Angomonas deanei TaxID=59799 RepID=A0A7G2CN41_9TRYP|nr:hypothetical protein, conserved [Angomonas deanei]